MSALELVVCIVFALILLAAVEAPACAWVIGRLRRARSHTDLVLTRPPVPALAPQAEPDAAWLDDQPAEVVEAAIYNRLFEDVVAGEFPETQRRTA